MTTQQGIGFRDAVGVERQADNEPVCEVPDADVELPAVPDPEQSDECGRRAGPFRKIARVVVPVLLGGAAVATVAALAGDSGSMAKALRSVQPGPVGLALLAEILSFVFLGLHLRSLGGPDSNVRRLAPLRLATVVFGLGSIMPAAPAEGLVMAGAALKHRRLARRRTILVLGVSQFFGTAGLYALAAIAALAVVVSAHDGPLAARGFLVAGGVSTLVLLVVVATVMTRRRFAECAGVLVGRIHHLRQPAPKQERRERGLAWHDAAMHVIRQPYKAPWLGLTMLLGWALDGSCMFFALAAVGARINLDVLLLAYSASAAASVIPFLPAGLGVVEAITPAILHLYGVPLETGLAGLLVYRAVGTALPALAGAASLATLRFFKAPDETKEEEAAAVAVATPAGAAVGA